MERVQKVLRTYGVDTIVLTPKRRVDYPRYNIYKFNKFPPAEGECRK